MQRMRANSEGLRDMLDRMREEALLAGGDPEAALPAQTRTLEGGASVLSGDRFASGP